MTPADWLTYAGQAMGNVAAFFGLFLTLITAYLVVAFVVGEKLTKSQVMLVNTSFVLCITLNLVSQGAALRNAIFAFGKASLEIEEMPAVPEIVLSSTPAITMFICAGITVGCLKFMWDIRHRKTS